MGKFVERRGLLTADGIANVYFCAETFGFTPEWLESNIHHDIPTKVKYMSKQNIIDTIAGVKKFHPDSSYLKLLEEFLSKTSNEEVSYAEHFKNCTVKYEVAENSSNNCLIYSAESKIHPLLYNIYDKVTSVIPDTIRKYSLHTL